MPMPNFDQPADCACFNLRRAARRVTQVYDRALKPAGLQATQFTLLSVLAGTDAGDGVPMTDLADSLGMDRTTLTRNLAVAERAGWVSLAPGPDRRERRALLTATGQSKLIEAKPYWQQAQAKAAQQLGRLGLTRLLELSRDMSRI